MLCGLRCFETPVRCIPACAYHNKPASGPTQAPGDDKPCGRNRSTCGRGPPVDVETVPRAPSGTSGSNAAESRPTTPYASPRSNGIFRRNRVQEPERPLSEQAGDSSGGGRRVTAAENGSLIAGNAAGNVSAFEYAAAAPASLPLPRSSQGSVLALMKKIAGGGASGSGPASEEFPGPCLPQSDSALPPSPDVPPPPMTRSSSALQRARKRVQGALQPVATRLRSMRSGGSSTLRAASFSDSAVTIGRLMHSDGCVAEFEGARPAIQTPSCRTVALQRCFSTTRYRVAAAPTCQGQARCLTHARHKSLLPTLQQHSAPPPLQVRGRVGR